jgi:hypothetical protein
VPERAKADTLDAAGLEQSRIRRRGDMLAEVRTALTRLRPVFREKIFPKKFVAQTRPEQRPVTIGRKM